MKNGRINERNIGSIKNDGGVKRRKKPIVDSKEIYARVCISGMLKTGQYIHSIESWTFYDAESLNDFLGNFDGDELSPLVIKTISVIPFSIAKRADEFDVFHIVKVQH
jgi:hypothetical protein